MSIGVTQHLIPILASLVIHCFIAFNKTMKPRHIQHIYAGICSVITECLKYYNLKTRLNRTLHKLKCKLKVILSNVTN